MKTVAEGNIFLSSLHSLSPPRRLAASVPLRLSVCLSVFIDISFLFPLFLRILQLENQRSSGNHLLTSGSAASLDASANQRSTMEIELLKAQREESKLKDASLIELSNQVKVLTASNDRLTLKCNDYEQLNVVLSTENKVCISLLSAARRREATNKVESY